MYAGHRPSRRGALAAVAATTRVVDPPNLIAQPKVQWRISTADPAVPSSTGEGGRGDGAQFRIEAFRGGQIMPRFGCFVPRASAAKVIAKAGGLVPPRATAGPAESS